MSENLEELATILPPHYKLDYDKLEITLVDGVPATVENFDELATILPFYYKLDLADNKFSMFYIYYYYTILKS